MFMFLKKPAVFSEGEMLASQDAAIALFPSILLHDNNTLLTRAVSYVFHYQANGSRVGLLRDAGLCQHCVCNLVHILCFF